MFRAIKYLFYLAIMVLLVLFGYSFVGDLSAPKTQVSEKVEPYSG